MNVGPRSLVVETNRALIALGLDQGEKAVLAGAKPGQCRGGLIGGGGKQTRPKEREDVLRLLEQ